ncbi:MAG: type IV secretion system DNA-binding domain-containing protein [Planctomycetes bacterium]|nr:type IV secretion system DNA-binding domain-containing protein [Planctomycetota bacterium]
MKTGLLLAMLALFVWVTFRRKDTERRGRSLLSRREAEQHEAQSERAHPESQITWGGVRLPRSAETSHFLVVGTTGSGKSLTLGQLMTQALSGARVGSDTRALVYDPKQEVLPFLAGLELEVPVVTLNAFDQRAAEWDMSADVTSPATALQIASAFLPEEGGSSNRYFSDTARDLMTGVLVSFIQSGEVWGLRDLVLTMRSRARLEEVLSRTDAGRDLLQMHAGDSRAFHNVLSTARSRLAPFEPVAAAWSRAKRRVSLRDWVRGEMVLVLGNDDSIRTAMDAINQVLFQRATELVLREPNSWTRRTWFFLDEVREAGKLGALPRLLNKGRSKGACVALGFQDIHGMKSVYGTEVALELVGQCSNKVLLRMESAETAKWAASTVGQYEEIQVLESRSRDAVDLTRGQTTRSEQRVTRDVVMPSEFLGIQPTSWRNGLTGYYLTPFVGVYRRTLPLAHFVGSGSGERGSPTPDFLERPESDQYLEPWTRRDLERLKLRSSLLQEEQSAVQEPSALELIAARNRSAA